MDNEPGHSVDPQAERTDTPADLSLSATPPAAPTPQEPTERPVLSFEQPGPGTNGHPESLVIAESLDQPPQLATLSQPTTINAEELSSSVQPTGMVGRATSVYAPHLKSLIVVGLASLLVLGSGAWVLVKTTHHTAQTPKQSTAALSVQPASAQELSINSKLKVAQDATLEKDLSVNGTTTLQGVVVKADAFVNGNVTVQGNGNFSGNIIASNFNGSTLTISGNSNFSGTMTVSNVTASGSLSVGGVVSATAFQGNFIGDGSKLTNLAAANCTDCVRLQTGTLTAQTGDVSIAGGLIGRKLHIQPSTDDTQAMSIQDANGANVLTVDTFHHQIRTADLLPETPGSIIAGSVTPGIDKNTIVADTGGAYDDNDKWAVRGPDGNMRLVYIDENTSAITYVRCKDKNCTDKVVASVAQDYANWTDSASIALDAQGNAYISYVDWTATNDLRVVHCLDADCAQTTDNLVGQYVDYNDAISVGGDNLPNIVYDTWQYDSNAGANLVGLSYIHCETTDCSSVSTQALVPAQLQYQDAQQWYFYYETQAITTDQDGYARIAYVHVNEEDGYTNPTRKLEYVRCTRYDCSTRTTKELDDADYYTSIAVNSDGLASIVYSTRDDVANTSSLHYAICSDADCNTFTTKVLDTGQTSSAPEGDIVLSPEGYPRISAYQVQSASSGPSPYYLKYYSCTDAACTGFTTTTIDSDIDYSNSLILGSDGLPQIVYVDKNSTALRLASLVTPDGSDIVVQSSVSSGATNIGTSTERFGQIYAQGLNIQTASTNAALVINQIPISPTGTGALQANGPIAQFQIGGFTHVAIDSQGTLQVQAASDQTANLQLWKDQGGTVRSGVDANGNIYAGSPVSGELLVGTASDGSLLRVVDANQKQVVTLDPQGALTLGALNSNTYIKTDYPFATGTQLSSIQVADLNHDGKPDIVTGNVQYVTPGSGVTVMLNTGDGFTSTLYPIAAYNPDIKLADFNGDGSPDIVVANSFYNFMSVMLNNGNGTFGSAVTYSAGATASNVFQLATADFNDDGKVDVVTSNAGSGTLSVMLNNGNGVFSLSTTATALTSGGYSASNLGGVVAGDFNDDGRPDFVTISMSYGGIYTFLNNGDGTFTAQDGGDFGYWSSITKAGDLNGDGKADIVLGSGGADCIATGNGDGTFAYGSCLNTAGTPGGITVSDLNNDGLPDIANVDSVGNISIFYAKSDHTFADRIDIPIKNQASYGLAASDFDGDGQTDFAVGGADANLSIYSAPIKERPSLVVAPAAGRQGIVLQSNTGQTADLLDVIDTVGHTSLSIGPDGSLSTDALTVTQDAAIKNNLSVSNTLKVGNIANVYGHDYSISGGSYTPATLDAGATTLTLTDDSVSSPITLPFSVSYFGVTYNSLSIGSDGYVSFRGGGIKGCRADVTAIKQSCAGSIVAAGSDLNPSSGGTIKYETVGTAPNRTFVVDFNNVAEFGNSGHATTQIQILENDGSQAANIIKLETGSINLLGQTFAQGLISADGTRVIYEPSHNNINTLGSGEVTYAYTPQFSNYNESNSFAVENQVFVGGDVQVQGSVATNKTITSTISAQPSLQFTAGSATTGLNVSWYNATSSNYSTIGAGTLAHQGIANSVQPFYAYCMPGFCSDPYWPTGVNTTYVNSRWTGWIKIDVSDNYTFALTPDDHAALYINNVLIVNALSGSCCQQKTGTTYLAGNAWYPIEYDFSQGTGSASSFVYWSNSASTTPAVIPFDHVSATLPGGYIASQGTLQLQSATAITNQSAAMVGLLIKASSGQTADLLELQTSTGAIVAKLDANGALTLAPTYQPISVTTNGVNAGAVLTVTGSKGGNTTGTSGQIGGTGAPISLTGGSGGNAATGSTNGSGGSITLQAGAPGTGGTGGSYGNVLVQPAGTGNVAIGNNAPGAKLHITIDTANKIGQIIRAASAQTGDLLQAQDSTGAVLASIAANGNLSVKAASVSGTLTINGHVISGNTSGTTTATVGVAAGTGATCTISGNDSAGKVTVVTGTSGVATGALCTISFANAYTSTPYVLLSANNASATALHYYSTAVTGNFTVTTNDVPAVSTTYIYFYWIVQ